MTEKKQTNHRKEADQRKASDMHRQGIRYSQALPMRRFVDLNSHWEKRSPGVQTLKGNRLLQCWRALCGSASLKAGTKQRTNGPHSQRDTVSFSRSNLKFGRARMLKRPPVQTARAAPKLTSQSVRVFTVIMGRSMTRRRNVSPSRHRGRQCREGFPAAFEAHG